MSELLDIEDIYKKPSAQKYGEMFHASRRRDPFDTQERIDFIFRFLHQRRTIYINPMTGQKVPVVNHDSYAFSFFSKDYDLFLLKYYDVKESQIFKQYKFHFSFSLNGDKKIEPLESGVRSSWTDRMDQLRVLCDIADEQYPGKAKYSIYVHYGDPFIRLRDKKTGEVFDTYDLTELAQVCEILNMYSINKLHFGFCDAKRNWSHVRRRLDQSGYELIDLDIEQKLEYLRPIAKFLEKNYPLIRLYTCADKDLIGLKPATKSIKTGVCFNGVEFNKVLVRHNLKPVSTKKRGVKDCNCTKLIDILDKPRKNTRCEHNCTYCFSNPL